MHNARVSLLLCVLLIAATGRAQSASPSQRGQTQLPDYTTLVPVVFTDMNQRITKLESDQSRLADELTVARRDNRRLQSALDDARAIAIANYQTARELRAALVGGNAPPEALTLVELLLPASERQSARGEAGRDGRDGIAGATGAVGKDGVGGKDGLAGKDGIPGRDGRDAPTALQDIADSSREFDVYSNFIASQATPTRLYQATELWVAMEPAKDNPAKVIQPAEVKLFHATRIRVAGDTLPFVHPNRHFDVDPVRVGKDEAYFTWKITPRPGQYSGVGPWDRSLYLSVAGSISAPLKYDVRIAPGWWWQRWFDATVLFFRGHAYATFIGIMSALFTLIVNIDKLRQIFRKKEAEPDPLDALQIGEQGDDSEDEQKHVA